MRILVVGVGFMGMLHARTVRGSTLASLAGVVDRDVSVATAAGAELGVPAHTDLRRAIEATRPDAAIIATPDPAHREPAEVAAAEGLALLVEKPLATTVVDAEAIVAAARRHRVRLMPGHLLRFDLRHARLAEVVHAGELGRPVVISAARWGLVSLGARVSASTTPLWHFLIHDIDVVQWLGGPVETIDGAGAVESPNGVAALTATGGLARGARFQLAAGWTLPEGTLGPRMTLEVHGELGHAALAADEEGLRIATRSRTRHDGGSAWPTIRGRIEGSLRREVDHFAAAVRDDTPFAITPADAVAAVATTTDLEAAMTGGPQWTDLP